MDWSKLTTFCGLIGALPSSEPRKCLGQWLSNVASSDQIAWGGPTFRSESWLVPWHLGP